jgi:hypothetical protein
MEITDGSEVSVYMSTHQGNRHRALRADLTSSILRLLIGRGGGGCQGRYFEIPIINIAVLIQYKNPVKLKKFILDTNNSGLLIIII